MLGLRHNIYSRHLLMGLTDLLLMVIARSTTRLYTSLHSYDIQLPFKYIFDNIQCKYKEYILLR